MAHQIMIVSPDAGLASSLRKALAEGGVETAPTVLGNYPTSAELRSLAASATSPLVFVVALTDQDKAIDLINTLRTSHSNFLVAAAAWKATSSAVLSAMRAGSTEFLVEPFDVSHLRRAIENAQEQTVRDGRLLCVLPAKAGSGASTLAIHLASAISGATQEKALLVDFDFYCGAVAYCMRLKPAFTLIDAISRVDLLDEMWPQITSSWEKVDILAPPPPGETLARERLRDIPAVFASARRSYNYTVVDLPPAVFSSCRHILELADTIYVVSTLETVCLHLAQRRVAELIACGLSEEKIRLIVGRAGSRIGLSFDDAAQVVGLPVHDTLPNDYTAVSDALLRGSLVPKRSRLGQQIIAMAGKITGVKATPPRQSSGWQNLFRPHATQAAGTG